MAGGERGSEPEGRRGPTSGRLRAIGAPPAFTGRKGVGGNHWGIWSRGEGVALKTRVACVHIHTPR